MDFNAAMLFSSILKSILLLLERSYNILHDYELEFRQSTARTYMMWWNDRDVFKLSFVMVC